MIFINEIVKRRARKPKNRLRRAKSKKNILTNASAKNGIAAIAAIENSKIGVNGNSGKLAAIEHLFGH